MPVFSLDKELIFPPVVLSEPDGLLAIGGDLSTDRLLLAYQNGIFPWPQDDMLLWWCPDPRFVLFPQELKISKAIKPLLNKKAFGFTINKDFINVIRHCSRTPRPGQDSTWITGEMEEAYIRMHELGYAHSAEVWQNGQLVGGLYGIRLDNVFFGESMFSLVSNASRYAFTCYVQQLAKEGVALIDCQVHTSYLESFGARMIPREEFITLIKQHIE